ncbi:MAG: hypothetical protein JNJ85_14275 [Candidatus Kapabacteria bacterium]|nr:hypothetical protein [Candidatus Kapabacteria bacterium]
MKVKFCAYYITMLSLFLGCSSIQPDEVIGIQKICELILSHPDTLTTIKRNSSISFFSPSILQSRDEQKSDSNHIVYLKKWFSTKYLIDTTYLFSKEYPYWNGKTSELIMRKVYCIEYKSENTDIEGGKIENRFFRFQFFNIHNNWLFAEHDTLSFEQMRIKFNKLNRHPVID